MLVALPPPPSFFLRSEKDCEKRTKQWACLGSWLAADATSPQPLYALPLRLSARLISSIPLPLLVPATQARYEGGSINEEISTKLQVSYMTW